MNVVLLTISLVSLAKSQTGKTCELQSTKNEKRRQYLDVGMYVRLWHITCTIGPT